MLNFCLAHALQEELAVQDSCIGLPPMPLKQCSAWTVSCVQSSTATLSAYALKI